jgi:tRNA nucleotidyltransferase (CCA-adding enzyme)
LHPIKAVNIVEWTKLKPKVLEQVKPTEEEELKVQAATERLQKDINGLMEAEGIEAEAELHGSVAHGTWVRGSEDLDLFIVLSPRYSRGDLHRVLDALKRHLGGDYVEAYAEHPYLRASIEGFNVDLVPCFRLEKGEKIRSSTDRTPLHSEYLAEVLTDGLRDEVRILKRFTETIGVYGAEIRVQGFSGYLCELLVVKYGSFEKLVTAAAGWKRREVVSLDSNLEEDELRKRFEGPLILVDPTDESRNVASALDHDSYWTFVAACRDFTENPDIKYFIHEQETSSETVLNLLKTQGSDFVFLVIDEHRAEVPDTLWGQLHKSGQALRQTLEASGFNVFRSNVWSDERHRHILVFQLESSTIPKVMKHVGPPVSMIRNTESFFETHLGAESTESGPWIESDRWVVLLRRQHTEAKELLEERLEDGGRSVGVSKNLAVRILQHHRILLNDEIEDYLVDGFVQHLYRLLIGRPHWVE